MPVPPPALDPRLRKPAKIVVLLGDTDGSRPAIDDRCDFLVPTSLTRDFGGGTLDSVTFRFDLDRYGSRLQDTALPTGHNRIVEVRVEDPITGDLDQVLGWGKLARQPQQVGDTESVGFVARLDHFLFGGRFVGFPVWDPNTRTIVTIRKPLTFNPHIDDVRLPNRSEITGSEGANNLGGWDADANTPTLTSGGGGAAAGDYYLVTDAGETDLDGYTGWREGEAVWFNGATWEPGVDPARLVIDPESWRTRESRLLQDAAVDRWDLASAVERLCWSLNRRERWIKNPTLAALQAVLGTTTALLENHTIALDTSLPEALDTLLAPHGFTWFVANTIDVTDPDLPITATIAVAERGQGLPVTLRLQRLADTIDSSKTNVDALTIAYDIAARPNVILGRSALALREGTFPLRPAWPKSDDQLTKADLTEELKEHDREHIDVFRKFVFDTAGDYGSAADATALRDDFNDGNVPLNDDVFGVTTAPMRRRFKPALSQGLDRQPIGQRGFLVEWHDGTQWRTVPWSFSVLEHEAGILLERGVDEEFRVEFLKKTRSVAAGQVPDPILRITCCLEGDRGETFTAARRAESANGVDVTRHYDLSHKFHDARVLFSGPFASVLYTDRHDAISDWVINSAQSGLGSQIQIAGDLTSVLLEGDRLAVLDSTDNDGVYHVDSTFVAAGPTTWIKLREPLADVSTIDGTLAYLTAEEKCDTQLAAYCEQIQAEEDFVVIHAEATLFGVDHPEYQLGQVVTKIEQRNLSLDSYAAAAVTQRHPQITRLTYQLDGRQTLSLVLDQFDRVTDRGFRRLLKSA